MELQEYPRPATDNGWGFHSASGAYEQPWMSQAWREKFSTASDIGSLTLPEKYKIMRDYAQMLHDEYGIRWFKLLAAGDSQLQFARALIEADIETIVRTYTHEPHPTFTVDPDLVKRYVDLGVHYIEWGNEPNLYVEWDDKHWDMGKRAKRVAEQIRRNFDKVRKGGGIPLFPAMSPGGHIDARQMLQDILTELKNADAIGDLEGAGVAVHNRPHNIPSAVPSSDTLTVAFREYEWIDGLITSFLGHSLPLFGTEAGYEIGDTTHPDYPAITGNTHASYNMDIFQGFKDQWRPSLFCVCMWLVEIYEKGNYSFANAAWWYNKIAGSAYPHSILPAVEALRMSPRFVRVMPWEEAPTPPNTALNVDVTWPPDEAKLTNDQIQLWGHVSAGKSTVFLQVGEADALRVLAGAGGEFSFSEVTLSQGDNRLELWATLPDGSVTSDHKVLTVSVTLPAGGGETDTGELEIRVAAMEAQLSDIANWSDKANATLTQVHTDIDAQSTRLNTIATELKGVADALSGG